MKAKKQHLPQQQQTSPSSVMKLSWGVRGSFASIMALLAGFLVFLTLTLSFKEGGGVPPPAEEESLLAGAAASTDDQCDWSSGTWVFDNTTRPLYDEEGCAFMSDQLACGKFGRKDLRYRYWRWQPHGCDLPRFNATALLERLRNKRIVFVGDSLNRGQWVSMVCLLDAVIPDRHKAMEANGSLVAFKAKDYNASIEFYWAPLLVESNSDHPVNHRLPERIVRASSIQKHAVRWSDADILVFNSYLWWRRKYMDVQWGAFDDDGGIQIRKKVKMLRSYELALRTWAEWLEFHVDRSKTKLYFMTMSPTHLQADEWGGDPRKNCYSEEEPIPGEGHRGRDTDGRMAEVVEDVVDELRRDRGVEVGIVNITAMSEQRKDGHPSVYRKQWDPPTEEQRDNPSSYSDCIHWCLPGVPDVWNELLYAHMLTR